jgi:hypothetical protein
MLALALLRTRRAAGGGDPKRRYNCPTKVIKNYGRIEVPIAWQSPTGLVGLVLDQQCPM